MAADIKEWIKQASSDEKAQMLSAAFGIAGVRDLAAFSVLGEGAREVMAAIYWQGFEDGYNAFEGIQQTERMHDAK